MLKRLFILFFIIFIICLSFFFRFNWLDRSPASVTYDEAALGYNAYSILETGRDEHGFFMPLSLASFNDYKPALYAYLSIPFIKLVGLNQFSTRAVSAIAGTLTLFFTFLIGYYFFSRSLKMGLLTLMVAALQPWGLHFSRTAFESNLAACFFTGGIAMIFADKGRISKFLAVIFFALSLYSYHSPRMAVPIFLFLLIIIANYKEVILKPRLFIKSIISKKFIISLLPLLTLVLLTLPIWLNVADGLILTRLRQEGALQRLSPFAPRELVNENIWTTFPANPAYYLSGQLVGHFFAYFSPINLGSRVFHWVRNSPQNIPSFSMIGWTESLIFIIGLIFMLTKISEKKYQVLLFWVIAGIAPAIITWQWFHPLRTLNIFPAITIIVVIGIIKIYELLSKKVRIILLPIVTILVLMQTSFLFNNEINYATAINSGEYQPGGYKEGLPVLTQLQNNYDKIIIETPHTQAYIFFLFYQSFPPSEIQKYQNTRKGPGNEGDLTFNFYKYEFRKIYWPTDQNLKNTLFWGTVYSLPEDKVDQVSGVISRNEIVGTVGDVAAVIVEKK
jgi:4-amino-4-deoxy-L-arabinose transferase-like glycosyltransferase